MFCESMIIFLGGLRLDLFLFFDRDVSGGFCAGVIVLSDACDTGGVSYWDLALVLARLTEP